MDYEYGFNRGKGRAGSVEILHSPVRKHHFSAAVQPGGQLGGGKVHWGTGAGRRGEQLRDHPHLPGICLWVQHWLLRGGIPALWREELPRHENGCVNRHDCQRCPVRRVDGLWHCQRRHAAAADSHAPGDLIRFEAVPGHLHLGSALSAVLQHRHGDFFRPG